jgi:hypothetical protein
MPASARALSSTRFNMPLDLHDDPSFALNFYNWVTFEHWEFHPLQHGPATRLRNFSLAQGRPVTPVTPTRVVPRSTRNNSYESNTSSRSTRASSCVVGTTTCVVLALVVGVSSLRGPR